MINSKIACQLFIERVMIDVYGRTYKDLESQLVEGLPGQADDASEMEKWYQNIGEADKNFLKEIIKITIKESIFGVLVILDNVSGGPPLLDRVSDFAIYVQSYNDLRTKSENRFQEAVRFNSSKDTDLHDLFLDLIDESSQL